MKVDEEGTEAVAVTYSDCILNEVGQPKSIIQFIVDRPFLFMIRNKNMPKNYEMLLMSKIEKL